MTSEAPVQRFEKLPSLGWAFVRALLGRRPGLGDGETIPRLDATLDGWTLRPDRLGRFNAVCGGGAPVPVSYPQLLATALHVQMLTGPGFPLKAIGLVHPRVRLVQHRPLRPDETLDFATWIDGHRDVENGIEFDLGTRVSSGGEVVWESEAATFSRSRARAEAPSKSPVASEPPSDEDVWDDCVEVRLPSNAGRRYASVSGDWNPIHLHPLLARLFGYRRPIGHGWWLLARCLGALEMDAAPGKAVVEARYLRPMFLPSTLALYSRRGDDGLRFSLRDPGAGGKPRLEGSVRRGEEAP